MSKKAGKKLLSGENRPEGASGGRGVSRALRLLFARRRLEFLILFYAPLLFLEACQKKPQSVATATPAAALVYFQRAELSFEAGNYAEAAQSYELYLQENGTPANQDRALFRLGLAHALAGSPVRDWTRAAAYFKQLTDTFPESLYAREARLILALQEDIERLQGDVERLEVDISRRDARIKQLSDELERFKEIDLQRRPSRPPR